MKIKQLEAILTQALNEAKTNGIKIVTHAFGCKAEGTCCAVSSINRKNEHTTLGMERLEVSGDKYWAIIRGFDGEKLKDPITESKSIVMQYYRLGRRLRNRFCPIMSDDFRQTEDGKKMLKKAGIL